MKNVELWQRLETLAHEHHVTWRWVRGHDGDPGNERADQLANRGLRRGALNAWRIPAPAGRANPVRGRPAVASRYSRAFVSG